MLHNTPSATTEAKNQRKFIGYRFVATGVFSYEFYEDEAKVCAVSSVVIPSPPVRISGLGLNWRSDFDQYSTIFPGLTRKVIDEANGETVFSLTYDSSNEYTLNESVSVFCYHEVYKFYLDGKVIATVKKFDGDTKDLKMPTKQFYDCTPYFDVTADSGIDNETLAGILSFPMLKFAI